MQFFPAALSHGAQLSRPGGLFDLMDAKPGQDFADLFSAHLNEAQPSDTSSPVGQPQAHPGPARDLADNAPSAPDRGQGIAPQSPGQDIRESSDRTAVAGRKEEKTGSGASEAAKDAGSKDGAARSEEGRESRRAASDDRPASAERSASRGGDAAQAAVLADESVPAEVRKLLDTLAADAARRGSGPEAAAVSARIEALQELLRQFRDAPPASRSELAVALGDQLKGLQRELAAMVKAEGAGERRDRTEAGSRAASRSGQKIEALLQRLEGRAVAGHGAADARPGGIAAAPSSVPGAVGTENKGERSRPLGARVAAMAAAQEAAGEISDPKRGARPETRASGAPGSAQGSELAARPASRLERADSTSEGRLEARGGASGPVSAKNTLIPAGPEDSTASATPSGKGVTAEGQPPQGAAKGHDGPVRPEAVVTNSGVAAAAGRSVPARDDTAQHPSQADPHRQAAPLGASEKARIADSGNAGSQSDARQGFFNEPDRDAAALASRAAQAAGGGKNVPESLTQASAQTAQTQFQQRLESPVGARSAQVYQQVENGAFRNLGQGVKQLVIRLDPADLGQVSVILQMRGKEVQAVLRASSQDTSMVLSEQLGQLRSQLEAQGLKVSRLEVQTQLADSQSQSQWQGAENHNRYQENQELAMSARRWRTLDRVASGLVRDVQNTPHRENLSQNGLDIFA